MPSRLRSTDLWIPGRVRTDPALQQVPFVMISGIASGGAEERARSSGAIRVTRELIRAGQTLKIEVLDHVIVGAAETHCSLRELRYFYS